MSVHSPHTGQHRSRPPDRVSESANGTKPGVSGKGAAALAGDLHAGCARLGLTLQPKQEELLLGYLDLLRKWNAVYNLTAIRTLPRMLVEHIFDSLAVVAPLAARPPAAPSDRAPCVVDIGSGAGLPGIVLAIVWPEAEIHLVEPVGKKAAFLRQCVGALGLSRVAVHALRVQELSLPRPADLVICRAFASLPDFLAAAAPLTGPETLVCAMKGVVPQAEISSLDAQWASPEVVALAVPELTAARHLVLLRRTADHVPRAQAGAAATDAAAVNVTPGAQRARPSRNGA
ncbi:MAG: 16S rRNA (guanine(527)-N(7))-methyltransferase RsmG [Burkholderiaceae bacterium]|nr:16S rRNA (guanine(527)-N(7))-methyltransferase RsmG [Burkholderiaceae bacterium]